MAIKFDDIIAANRSDGVLTTSYQITFSTEDKLKVGSDITTTFFIDSTNIAKSYQIAHDKFKSITFLSEYPKAVDTVINEVINVTTNVITELANKINDSASSDLNITTDKYLLCGSALTKDNIITALKNLTVGSYGYVEYDINLTTSSLVYSTATNVPFSDLSVIPKNTLIKAISTDISKLSINDSDSYALSNNIAIIAIPRDTTTDTDLSNRVAALEKLLKLTTSA